MKFYRRTCRLCDCKTWLGELLRPCRMRFGGHFCESARAPQSRFRKTLCGDPQALLRSLTMSQDVDCMEPCSEAFQSVAIGDFVCPDSSSQHASVRMR